MKDVLKVLFVLGLVVLGIWIAVSDWQDCRRVHSWGYCFRHSGAK